MPAMANTPLVEEETASRLIKYKVDFGIDGDPACHVAVEIFWPCGSMLPVVLFCLPGGAMNRRFYDLADKDARFSFAKQMAARGFVCVIVDLPGVGDSDRPRDGYELTPARVTDILAQTHERVCADISAGKIDDDLPPLPQHQSIGIGHSFGAMFTVLQQRHSRPHTAIALLGFATHGLPEYLSADALALATDTRAVRAQLVPLAKKMFRESYPEMGSSAGSELYGGANADRDAVQALKAARDRLLPVPAFMSILPGNVAPEAADIDVPVFVALGEADFVKPPDNANAGFGRSPAVDLLMLPDTGHSFFLFESRAFLFDRLAQWARGVADIK